MKSFFKSIRNQIIFGSFIILSAGVGYAVVTIPNTFIAGTTASADQVNENFAALKSAVDTLQTQVSTLQAANPLPSAAGKLAYAFVNEDGEVVRSFNSSGGTNSAVLDTHVYTVTFPGLADAGSFDGNIQVTAATSDRVFCTADPDANGSDIVVTVVCNGVESIGQVDADFMILYIE